MTSKNKDHVLEIKSTQLMALRLVLKTTDYSAIVETLNEKMVQSGAFFEGETLVIDASPIVQNLPWKKLVTVLEQHKFKVLGIHANEYLKPGILEAGYTYVDLGPAAKPASPEKQASAPRPGAPIVAPNHEGLNPTMVIKRQLRSGQRIYAKNSDLIVIGSVGHGAEIIADGNIHVYGQLLGRAIAGAKGDHEARIFTSYLDPELVAIAGVYRLFDAEFTPVGLKKSVIIELANDSLSFSEL